MIASLKLENRYEVSAKNEPVLRWLFVIWYVLIPRQ